MSLRTRAAEIQRFSDRYQRRRNLAGDIATVQERREVIARARRRIHEALEALSAMSQATDEDPPEMMADVTADLARVKRQAEALREDPSPLREPNSDEFRVLRAQINAAAESLGNLAKDSWRDFVTARRPPRVDPLVRAFGSQKPHVAERLEETAGQLRLVVENVTLPNPSQIERVEKLHGHVAELQTELIGDGASRELMTLIHAAGSPEGAPMALLTDRAWEEIERFGIDDAFRVFLA